MRWKHSSTRREAGAGTIAALRSDDVSSGVDVRYIWCWWFQSDKSAAAGA
jgi:hypothetical protein